MLSSMGILKISEEIPSFHAIVKVGKYGLSHTVLPRKLTKQHTTPSIALLSDSSNTYHRLCPRRIFRAWCHDYLDLLYPRRHYSFQFFLPQNTPIVYIIYRSTSPEYLDILAIGRYERQLPEHIVERTYLGQWGLLYIGHQSSIVKAHGISLYHYFFQSRHLCRQGDVTHVSTANYPAFFARIAQHRHTHQSLFGNIAYLEATIITACRTFHESSIWQCIYHHIGISQWSTCSLLYHLALDHALRISHLGYHTEQAHH